MAGVRESTASAEQILRAAFPRGRARAVRWLSWIAWRAQESGSFGWWDVPRWLGEPVLLRPRRAVSGILAGTGFGLALGLYNGGSAGLGAGFALGMGAWWLAGKWAPGPLRGTRVPYVLAPRLPRTWRAARMVAIGLLTGVMLRSVLTAQWARPVPADVSPAGAYRACLRSTLIDGAVCLSAGLPWIVAALVMGWPSLLVPAGLLTCLALLGALADGKIPAVWLACPARPPHPRRWDAFRRLGSARRLLARAERHGVLRADGARYAFASETMRAYLTGLEQAMIDAGAARTEERERTARAMRERRAARTLRNAEAAAAASPGLRTWLLRLLAEPALNRLGTDLGIGAAAGVGAAIVLLTASPGVAGTVIGVIVVGGFLAFLCRAVARFALAVLAGRLRWSLWLTGRMTQRVRTGVLASVVCAAGLIVLAAGPAVARHALAVAGVAVLPGLVVAVVGGWGASLVHRRWRDVASPPASPRWRRAAALLTRHAADGLAACVTGTAVLLWIDQGLLGAQAAAALLFPLAVWLSIRAWRWMSSSDRVEVRAAADITVSLLLGSSLTGLLVCVANMLKMPPDEVAVLRDIADRTGAALDVRWWIWVSVYAVLAAAGVAFVLRPGRVRRLTGAIARLRLVPAAEILRRGSAGAHVGLLLVALIGAAGPAAIGPVLRVRLADRYTLTLTDTARERGAAAELRRIASGFALLPGPLAVPLADLLLDIHRASDQPADQGQPGSVEIDLVRRLAALQASTLAAAESPPPVEQAEARVTREAGLDEPAGGAVAEGERLGELADAEHEDDTAKEQAEQSGELAATAIAKTLPPLPGLGTGEVIGMLKEYLSALIEFSPLKDTFAAWAERLGSRTEPPAVADLVIPDPARLKDAAAAQVNQELAKNPVSDPAAVNTLLAESGIAGAVSLANQTRYLQESATGPCEGCARPESGTDHGTGRAPEEPPVEPIP